MSNPSNGTIVIEDVCTQSADGSLELSARIVIEGDARLPNLPERIWIRVPASETDAVVATADPFVPPAWLVAAKHGLDVRVPDGVSARLAGGLAVAGALYEDWSERLYGERFRVPALHALTVQRERRGDGAAAFFSGGVDSMFTLGHNLRRFPRTDSRAIKGLVLVHGLDIALTSRERFARTAAVLGEVASAVDVPLIAPVTNVRDFVSGLDWFSFGHGPCLALVGLALSGRFHTIYVPSSYPYVELALCGTHPALDPHWSTEAIEFVHDGAAFGRTQKIMSLASQPALVAGLRVCWKNVANDYNCGRCEKCLRTMVTLALHGLASQASQFPAIDRAALDQVRLKPTSRPFWEDIQRWSTGERFDPGLQAIVAEVLARPLLEPATRPAAETASEPWPVKMMMAVSKRVGERPRKVVGALDRWLFGGRLRHSVWVADARERARARHSN
jgi:hypothetical protein